MSPGYLSLMNSSATKTLLALLLAFRELKVPLSIDEQEVLHNVGRELELDPDYWEEIEEDLMAMIKANAALNHLFQLNRAKVDALDGQIPRELLPSLAELEEELFTETRQVVTRDGSSKDISSHNKRLLSRQTREHPKDYHFARPRVSPGQDHHSPKKTLSTNHDQDSV